MKYYPTGSFGNLGDGDLAVIAMEVAEGLRGNTDFPEPTVSPDDMITATIAFLTAKGIMKSKPLPKNTKTKNDEKDALIEILQANKIYVRSKCKGDKEKVLSTGYSATKEKTTPVLPVQVEGLMYGFDMKTRLSDFVWNDAEDCDSYNFEYREVTETETAWTTFNTVTVAKISVDIFTKGKKYQARVVGTNSQGNGPASEEVTFFAN